MTFTAIDFETTHATFRCEIGVTRVVDGVITFTSSQLIKPACFPYMNYWNQRVYGITSGDVALALTFEGLWGKLQPWLDDFRADALENNNSTMFLIRKLIT